MKHNTMPSDAACGLPGYISVSRYARYSPALGRRESWEEAVARVRDMHLSSFENVSLNGAAYLPEMLHPAINEAFAGVANKEVLPSMRSLQFGGDAILNKHARIYNCAFSHLDRVEFFREAFWLLLCGTGTGFSVQGVHVDQLPALAEFSTDNWRIHQVEDTIEGWADALDLLIREHIAGRTVEFDFSAIRPAGSPLKTSGGKAPGPEPLEEALNSIRRVLSKAAGRKLKSIEAYDIVMFSAKAVLSGGIRRSATLCLFDAHDEDMMKAKTGNWFAENPQRSASNNSAVLIRNKVTREQFDLLFQSQKEFGEPGFYFAESEQYGCNPCCEIGIHPRLKVTPEAIAKLRAYGYKGPLQVGQVLSGWQMCNLVTISAKHATTPEKFYRLCAKSALIGTLQAAYTVFEYLGAVSRLITENEALLGVSICGVLDAPDVLLNPAVLESGAKVVRETNALVARAIGINAAARTCTLKPEGTSALTLGTGSGIHPLHAPRYFRRVQANKLDPIFQHFARQNPHMIEDSVYDKSGNTAVITFAIESPAGAVFRDDLTAARHLEMVSLVQKHWVQAGRAYETFSPGLHHNVSNTISVRPEEWDTVANYIWDNRHTFTGVALLQFMGDKAYAQAPNEALADEKDVARWEAIRASYVPVDYTALSEKEDVTELKQTVACAGGACSLV